MNSQPEPQPPNNKKSKTTHSLPTSKLEPTTDVIQPTEYINAISWPCGEADWEAMSVNGNIDKIELCIPAYIFTHPARSWCRMSTEENVTYDKRRNYLALIKLFGYLAV